MVSWLVDAIAVCVNSSVDGRYIVSFVRMQRDVTRLSHAPPRGEES